MSEEFGKAYTKLILNEYFGKEGQVVMHTGNSFTLSRQKINEKNGDKVWTDGAFLSDKDGRYVPNPKELNGFYSIVGASYCVLKLCAEEPILHFTGKLEELNIGHISHLNLK